MSLQLSYRPKIIFGRQKGVKLPLQTPAQNFIILIMTGMIYLSTLGLVGGVSAWRFLRHQSVLASSGVSVMMIVLFAMLALIAFICILIVAFVTHSGLIIHRPVIEILQLLGAKDKFIAQQFQNHATKIAFKAALMGGGSAAFTFIFLKPSGDSNWICAVNSSLINEIWFIIIFLPFLMILTVILATRLTVLLALQKDGDN